LVCRWGLWGSTKNADGTVTTNQTVNPNMTAKIDNFYGAPKGVSVLHEVIESYIGGKTHLALELQHLLMSKIKHQLELRMKVLTLKQKL